MKRNGRMIVRLNNTENNGKRSIWLGFVRNLCLTAQPKLAASVMKTSGVKMLLVSKKAKRSPDIPDNTTDGRIPRSPPAISQGTATRNIQCWTGRVSAKLWFSNGTDRPKNGVNSRTKILKTAIQISICLSSLSPRSRNRMTNQRIKQNQTNHPMMAIGSSGRFIEYSSKLGVRKFNISI